MTKKKNNCIPIFFPNFRPFFTLPSSVYPPPDDRHAPSTNRGDQPTARRPYMANILYYTLNFTSTGSPSPRSGGALPPPSPLHPNLHAPCWTMAGPSHVSYTIFFQKKMSKIFWGPFPGPPGLTTPFSNSPSHATYPQIFPTSPPLFTPTAKRWTFSSTVTPTPP